LNKNTVFIFVLIGHRAWRCAKPLEKASGGQIFSPRVEPEKLFRLPCP